MITSFEQVTFYLVSDHDPHDHLISYILYISIYYSNYQTYLLILIEDVVPTFNTELDGIFWKLCFSNLKDWVCYQQEVLKIFPGPPPVSCNAFDVDYHFKDFVLTDVLKLSFNMPS